MEMSIHEYQIIAKRVSETHLSERHGKVPLTLTGSGDCNCYGTCAFVDKRGYFWVKYVSTPHRDKGIV